MIRMLRRIFGLNQDVQNAPAQNRPLLHGEFARITKAGKVAANAVGYTDAFLIDKHGIIQNRARLQDPDQRPDDDDNVLLINNRAVYIRYRSYIDLYRYKDDVDMPLSNEREYVVRRLLRSDQRKTVVDEISARISVGVTFDFSDDEQNTNNDLTIARAIYTAMGENPQILTIDGFERYIGNLIKNLAVGAISNHIKDNAISTNSLPFRNWIEDHLCEKIQGGLGNQAEEILHYARLHNANAENVANPRSKRGRIWQYIFPLKPFQSVRRMVITYCSYLITGVVGAVVVVAALLIWCPLCPPPPLPEVTIGIGNDYANLGSATCLPRSCSNMLGETVSVTARPNNNSIVFQYWICDWCNPVVNLRDPEVTLTVPDDVDEPTITPVFLEYQEATLEVEGVFESDQTRLLAELNGVISGLTGCNSSENCTIEERPSSSNEYQYSFRFPKDETINIELRVRQDVSLTPQSKFRYTLDPNRRELDCISGVSCTAGRNIIEGDLIVDIALNASTRLTLMYDEIARLSSIRQGQGSGQIDLVCRPSETCESTLPFDATVNINADDDSYISGLECTPDPGCPKITGEPTEFPVRLSNLNQSVSIEVTFNKIPTARLVVVRGGNREGRLDRLTVIDDNGINVTGTACENTTTCDLRYGWEARITATPNDGNKVRWECSGGNCPDADEPGLMNATQDITNLVTNRPTTYYTAVFESEFTPPENLPAGLPRKENVIQVDSLSGSEISSKLREAGIEAEDAILYHTDERTGEKAYYIHNTYLLVQVADFTDRTEDDSIEIGYSSRSGIIDSDIPDGIEMYGAATSSTKLLTLMERTCAWLNKTEMCRNGERVPDEDGGFQGDDGFRVNLSRDNDEFAGKTYIAVINGEEYPQNMNRGGLVERDGYGHFQFYGRQPRLEVGEIYVFRFRLGNEYVELAEEDWQQIDPNGPFATSFR